MSAMFPPTPERHGPEESEALVRHVQTKRAEVERYLATVGAQSRRLVSVAIVAGAVAAALTAAPALGGQPFADWLTTTFSLSSPSWRILCAVACWCSMAATIATQLHRSRNYEELLARAQGARATLETLEVGIMSGHFSLHEATTQYLNCVESTSFIGADR